MAQPLSLKDSCAALDLSRPHEYIIIKFDGRAREKLQFFFGKNPNVKKPPEKQARGRKKVPGKRVLISATATPQTAEEVRMSAAAAGLPVARMAGLLIELGLLGYVRDKKSGQRAHKE